MKMKCTVVSFFCLVAFVSGNGLDGIKQEMEDVLTKAKEFIENEYREIDEGLKGAENRAKTALSSSTFVPRSSHEAVLAELDRLPSHCAEKGRTALRQQWPDFFHCPNLTYFRSDVDALVVGGFDMTRSLLSIAVDFFHGYSLCVGWNPFKWIPCYVENTYHLLKDVRTSMTLVNDYFTNFITVVNNMTASYEYCRANSPTLFAAVDALGPAYECAKTVPSEN